MKSYYQHAGIEIYHGDCREVMGCLPVAFCRRCNEPLSDQEILAIHLAAQHEVGPFCDVLITDPPYGIGLSNHAAGKERRLEGYDIANDHSSEAGQWLADWADNRGIPLVMFASPWNPFNGDWRNLLVWDKGPAVGGGGDTATCFKRTWELIQVARNLPLNGDRDCSVLSYWITPQDTTEHIAAKPLPLMKYLVSKLTHEHHAICDPFMGSGTSLVAAKDLGRRAIGIEIEEKYCEIAAKRLSQEVLDFK